jgi:hypothetical protein
MCRIRTILKDNLFFLHVLPIAGLLLFFCVVSFESRAESPAPRREIPLDGSWHIATDAENVGRDEQWFSAIRPEAKETRVPWIIQEPFPGYHGVAWYWHSFIAPARPETPVQYALRFWAVDYKADVWLNDTYLGSHEGGESPFMLDANDAIQPGKKNLLAVRVLNPRDEPIDGIVLAQTAHRNKVNAYWAGASFNHGGITDSVELLVLPLVWLEDVFVRADAATGVLQIQAEVRNDTGTAVPVEIALEAGSAREGSVQASGSVACTAAAGSTTAASDLQIASPRLWDLNDPYLYRVTARLSAPGRETVDTVSVRTGFRDFRFENGYFRLNGRRIFLKGSHTGNHCPIGLQLPHDPDLLRRDLLNVKAMGFNMIRFIAGVARREQLDLCDELGLLVYEESYAGWCMEFSPQFADRYDESVLGMIKRDRNHASIVIWGLLNETPDGPVFRHALAALPSVRALDDSRMVLLNSGRWDNLNDVPLSGLRFWQNPNRTEPCVTFNATEHALSGYGITWQPGQMALHPGPNGEYSVVRWTAPAGGKAVIDAVFSSIAERATTDVHVLYNGTPLFGALINLEGGGPAAEHQAEVELSTGDTVDFVVGWGNGDYGADTTALAASVTTAGGETFDAAKAFSIAANPTGPWCYGMLAPGPVPDAAALTLYPVGNQYDDSLSIGSLSNPGSDAWEDVLHDQHCYPRVPHTGEIIRSLREYRGGGHPAGMGEGGYPPEDPDAPAEPPVFLSEYGIGSAVNLARVVRLYEQLGAADLEDAQYYATQLDRFMGDWERWRLHDTFGTPEDYFAACLAKMAGQRTLGLNAIRSNPNFVGYSLTGTVDQGMTGEGLTTTFREFKPGTFDAVYDGFAPLRWCLFAEPAHVYAGGTVRFDAVLANEDALAPGTYPARFRIFGPNQEVVFDETTEVTIPAKTNGREPPFAFPVLSREVAIPGPAGRYRCTAVFERGAAAAGYEAEFFVSTPYEAPRTEGGVAVWSDDSALRDWLAGHGVDVTPFNADSPAKAIIVSHTPGPGPLDEAWAALHNAIQTGSTAVFLSPGVFRNGDDPVARLPLEQKGHLKAIGGWLYLKDEWAKDHTVFDGLPDGGLLDYRFYREIIPDLVFADFPPPREAIAGAIKTSQAYDSGLLTAVYDVGEGKIVLNTLRIREFLGQHPVSDRLLMNMVRFAQEGAHDE